MPVSCRYIKTSVRPCRPRRLSGARLVSSRCETCPVEWLAYRLMLSTVDLQLRSNSLSAIEALPLKEPRAVVSHFAGPCYIGFGDFEIVDASARGMNQSEFRSLLTGPRPQRLPKDRPVAGCFPCSGPVFKNPASRRRVFHDLRLGLRCFEFRKCKNRLYLTAGGVF